MEDERSFYSIMVNQDWGNDEAIDFLLEFISRHGLKEELDIAARVYDREFESD